MVKNEQKHVFICDNTCKQTMEYLNSVMRSMPIRKDIPASVMDNNKRMKELKIELIKKNTQDS